MVIAISDSGIAISDSGEGQKVIAMKSERVIAINQNH